jgi:hypothetical protein
MAPAHQRHEAFALDARSGSQAEGLNAGAQPHTGCLTAAGVVVLRAGGDLSLVVLELTRGGAELSDRQHATVRVEAKMSNTPEQQGPQVTNRSTGGHKTDTSARKPAITAAPPDPPQRAAFAGHSLPPIAARDRS